MTDTVRLDDVRHIPDMTIGPDDIYGPNGNITPDQLEIVPLDEFVSVTEDVAEPLIGTPDDSLLPVDGMLLMYGDGGAGKTTLSIDALAHLASGTDWLGLTVPKPLRILLIENEGPRGPFRQRLATKINTWNNTPFSPNVTVLQEPWTRFTLTDPNYRQQLGQHLTTHQADLLIVGPLASLGARGTGTPDEINDFHLLIQDLRNHTTRPFAIWIVHHENKAGDVSGAWERYPDTLVHIQAQGNGRTRVYWRKVRWSSTLHGTSSNLIWADGNGFTIEHKPERDIASELTTAFQETNEWHTARDAKNLIGANLDTVRETLVQLVQQGVMITQKGPPGRHATALCWRLKGDPDPQSHPESPTPLEGFARLGDSVTPPIRESQSESPRSEPDETDSPDPSQVTHLDVNDPAVQALLDDNPPW